MFDLIPRPDSMNLARGASPPSPHQGVTLSRLRRIAQLPMKARADALEKLIILSGLRKLEKKVREEIEAMSISIDIMENDFLRDLFTKGRQEGRQEGEQTGILKGRQEGRQEGVANAFLLLLHERFGANLPGWVSVRLNSADEQTLSTWMVQILKAPTLEDVFQC